MFGIVIDKETKFVIDKCVIVADYEPKETEEVIPYEYDLGNPVGKMNKPQLIDGKWIDTDPLPPVVQEPNEMEVLNEQVVALEKENKLLKAQVEVLSQTADFHEELIAEMAMQVYA